MFTLMLVAAAAAAAFLLLALLAPVPGEPGPLAFVARPLARRRRLLAGVRRVVRAGFDRFAASEFRPYAPAVSVFVIVALHLAFGPVLLAESPWVSAIDAVCDAFVGPIGKGLALVALIVGGLMFAFGEGGSKSQIAGLIFGAGLVLGAPNFIKWLGIGGKAAIACGQA